MNLRILPTLPTGTHRTGDFVQPPLDKRPCRVLVKRALMLGTERQAAGSVLRLERWLGQQLVDAGRAEFVKD
jgi:hypothetical protein